MNAILVIDKVPGPTSFDVVREVKRSLEEKVGHAGSLDPFASGVLLLLVGYATKISDHLLNSNKRYVAKIKLGEATDTLDRTGEVVAKKDLPPAVESDIEDVLQYFRGTWMQIPPMFSAKKRMGVRLYTLARSKISIPRDPIPVQIYELSLKSFEPPFIELMVHCSKGTYVRSLADELARRLGTVGHLYELRRLSCGDFDISQSVTLESFLMDTKRYLARGFENYRNFLDRLRMEPVLDVGSISMN